MASTFIRSLFALTLALALCWPLLAGALDTRQLDHALATQPAAEAEARVARALRALRDAPETPALRHWVRSLTDYESRSFRPHPEGRGRELPAYPIAALAQRQLERWDLAAEVAALDPTAARLRAKALSPADRQPVLAAWLRQADDAALDAFLSHPESATVLGEAALLALLERRETPELWLTLASRAYSAAALHALQGAINGLAPADARRLLAAVKDNPVLIPGAAALEGRLAQRDVITAERLRRRLLAEPLSAASIESAHQAGLLDLQRLLSERLAEPEQAPLAAWGLWRLGTPQARSMLATYAADPAALPHLAEEIRAWLD